MTAAFPYPCRTTPRGGGGREGGGVGFGFSSAVPPAWPTSWPPAPASVSNAFRNNFGCVLNRLRCRRDVFYGASAASQTFFVWPGNSKTLQNLCFSTFLRLWFELIFLTKPGQPATPKEPFDVLGGGCEDSLGFLGAQGRPNKAPKSPERTTRIPLGALLHPPWGTQHPSKT